VYLHGGWDGDRALGDLWAVQEPGEGGAGGGGWWRRVVVPADGPAPAPRLGHAVALLAGSGPLLFFAQACLN